MSISWSGEASNGVAIALREWLPLVLAEKVKPFVSSEDVEKGSRGLDRIAAELEESAFGIVIVTPSNLSSSWMAFEAGALGKSVSTGRVSPVLVGLSDADLTGPLKQFQNVNAADKGQMLALVKSINRATTDPLPEATVEVLFHSAWEDIEAAISVAVTAAPVERAPQRQSADMLEEVLTTVRTVQRDLSQVRLEVDRGARYRRRDVDVDLIDDEITGLLLEAGATGLEWASSRQAISITLGQGTPTLPVHTLAQIGDLARERNGTVTIDRHDGSSVQFDARGHEIRRAAPGGRGGFDKASYRSVDETSTTSVEDAG